MNFHISRHCWRGYCLNPILAGSSALNLAKRMKLKLTGLFRNLLGRTETPASEVPAERPLASSAPAHQEPSASSPQTNQVQVPPSSQPDLSHPDDLAIPLLSITNALPMDLKAKLAGTPAPGRLVYIPLETVINQLAFGAVKITFGELRQMAAGLFVSGLNGNYDNRTVTVPLNEILSRINPALLARRPAAPQVEVSDEIAGPFAGHGRGVSFTEQPLKGAPLPSGSTSRITKASVSNGGIRETKPAASPIPREIKPAASISFTPPASPPPSAAPIAAPQIPPRPSRMAPPSGLGSGPDISSPVMPGAVRPLSTPPHSDRANHSAVLPPFKFKATPPSPPPAGKPDAGAPIRMASTQADFPSAQHVAAPAPVTPQPPGISISLPLTSLWEKWPEEIKGSIAAQGYAQAMVTLPLHLVEPGLKRGRILLSWRELRLNINPASSPTSMDDLELDLSLAVVAPAFLAAQRKAAGQQQSRVAVSEEIPNLFFGFPQADNTDPVPSAPLPGHANGPVTPGTSLRARQPDALPKPPVKPSGPVLPPTLHAMPGLRHGDTNLFSPPGKAGGALEESTFFRKSNSPATDFMSRQMQPKEVVARAMAMSGVAGAVVALADGLRVEGQVPPEFNADTIAAFLPQIFERVNQSTRELRMGALNNVSFTVGNVPWKIYRVGSIYFAVFGRPDEPFPKAELAHLAAGLNRKPKT